jgi:hypothetical protein
MLFPSPRHGSTHEYTLQLALGVYRCMRLKFTQAAEVER